MWINKVIRKSNILSLTPRKLGIKKQPFEIAFIVCLKITFCSIDNIQN